MSIAGLSGTDAASLSANYMNLLVEQMKNQDPLDPMDNSQMTAQLAQLSQLDQLQGMNSTFDKVLALTQMTQATSMIGKTVSFSPDGQNMLTGNVDAVNMASGKVTLQIGQYSVDPTTVLNVTNTQSTAAQ